MKRKTYQKLLALTALILMLALGLAGYPLQIKAQEPEIKPAAGIGTAFTYQGRLTDGGNPATGSYDLRFILYNAEIGGAQVGGVINREDVAVADGFFTAQLDFGAVFDGTTLWLEIAVRPGDSSGSYTTLSPRHTLTATPYALRAKLADNSLGTLSCTTDQIAKFNGTNWVCTADQSAALQAQLNILKTQVNALETLLTHVSRRGNDLYITGANLHVVNGTGTTSGDPNSLGNVIIGYNIERPTGNDRSGSHMLVVGPFHNYSSYGGIVVGYENTASGEYASVTGGRFNTASGDFSSVAGGSHNTASGYISSVSGGGINTASGDSSSISGGQRNTASGDSSSITGGRYNTAGGNYAAVSGGVDNTASGYVSSVSGGQLNTAGADYSSVSGGANNTAGGIRASVSGGASNVANGRWSSVSGGLNRSVSGDLDWRAGGYFQTQ